MALQLIGSGNTQGVGGRINVPIPAGTWKTFEVRFDGTLVSGASLATNPITEVLLTRVGKDKINDNFRRLLMLSDLLYGDVPDSQSAASNQTTEAKLAAILPTSWGGVPNAMFVEEATEAVLALNLDAGFAGTGLVTTGMQYEVYGDSDPTASEAYEVIFERQDEMFSGAGTKQPTLTGPNIAALLIEDPSGILDTVQFSVDNEVLVNTVKYEVLNEWSSTFGQVESPVDLTLVPIMERGNLASAYNRNVQSQIKATGAGTVKITKVRLAPADPGKRSRSREAAAQALARRIANTPTTFVT